MSFPQQQPDNSYQYPYPPAYNQPADPNPPYKPAGFPDQTPPQPASGNGCLWGCLFIGLFALLLLIGSCIGGYIYVRNNAKNIITNLARQGIVAGIEGSELSKDDKQQVIAEVDRVVEAYKEGKLDETDVQNILKELETSPLIPLFVCYGVEKQYLDKSGLTDAEKADARKQLQRLIRGGMDKKISQSDIESLMQPLQQTGPNGEKQMKPVLTDAEIKTFIAGVKKLADDAMVPDEEFKVDIGDEVKRIVDQGLAKGKK